MVPVCRVAVSMADGASVVAFVYAPVGVVDAPGTPFAVTRNPAPVVVLHGNGESHEHMAGIIEPLARTRSVIAVDSRGHGASTRGTDPLSYELMAADALEAMSRLGVTQAHVLGYVFDVPLMVCAAFALHLSGCAGDLFAIWLAARTPHCTHCQDTERGVRLLG